jgi:hypothetical protein
MIFETLPKGIRADRNKGEMAVTWNDGHISIYFDNVTLAQIVVQPRA